MKLGRVQIGIAIAALSLLAIGLTLWALRPGGASAPRYVMWLVMHGAPMTFLIGVLLIISALIPRLARR